MDSTVSDFLTAQCQLAMDGPRLRPLSIRPECPGSGRQVTNGAADGSDDSDDQVNTFFVQNGLDRPLILVY